MKILNPLITIIGLLYAFYMAAWYYWLAALYADKPHAVEFCSVWWIVYLLGLLLSLVSLVFFFVTVYRKGDKGRYGLQTVVYLAVYALLIFGGFMWI